MCLWRRIAGAPNLAPPDDIVSATGGIEAERRGTLVQHPSAQGLRQAARAEHRRSHGRFRVCGRPTDSRTVSHGRFFAQLRLLPLHRQPQAPVPPPRRSSHARRRHACTRRAGERPARGHIRSAHSRSRGRNSRSDRVPSGHTASTSSQGGTSAAQTPQAASSGSHYAKTGRQSRPQYRVHQQEKEGLAQDHSLLIRAVYPLLTTVAPLYFELR